MPHVLPAARAGAALVALATPATLAQAPPDAVEATTEWSCWYNHDTTFRCRLTRAPDVADDPGAGPAQSEGRSSLLPRRGPLPPIVRTIRERPGRLRGRTIVIPLFSPPSDSGFATLLVQSVMCGELLTCHARIFRSAADAAEAYEEDPARAE